MKQIILGVFILSLALGACTTTGRPSKMVPDKVKIVGIEVVKGHDAIPDAALPKLKMAVETAIAARKLTGDEAELEVRIDRLYVQSGKQAWASMLTNANKLYLMVTVKSKDRGPIVAFEVQREEPPAASGVVGDAWGALMNGAAETIANQFR